MGNSQYWAARNLSFLSRQISKAHCLRPIEGLLIRRKRFAIEFFERKACKTKNLTFCQLRVSEWTSSFLGQALNPLPCCMHYLLSLIQSLKSNSISSIFTILFEVFHYSNNLSCWVHSWKKWKLRGVSFLLRHQTCLLTNFQDASTSKL